MYPFWKTVLFPALTAAEAKTVLEIGALRGENTQQLIRDIGEDAIVHVIDPVPDFDPAIHEAEFPGQYIFHRALSLEVLDDLPPMDAALIDGDHNWYTVYNECHALARVADAAGQPLPLLLLHDVSWPYGRRDLYYDPSNIPAEHRRPYAVRGINRGNNKLQPRGGFNKTLANAQEYGGPRNGVLTGLEDFLAEFERPYEMVLLPIYYGLALVAETAMLDQRPELAAIFSHLQSLQGKDEVIQLSEDIRLDAAMAEQNYLGEFMRRSTELGAEYLDVVQASIQGDLGLEQTARIDYLRRAASASNTGEGVDELAMADPLRRLRPETRRAQARHLTGAQSITVEGPLSSAGEVGLAAIRDSLDAVVAEGVPGDYVDIGTERGGVAMLMRAHTKATYESARHVWVADEFDATTPGDLSTVRENFDRHGLLDDATTFVAGSPAVALDSNELKAIAVLRVGPIGATHLAAVLAEVYPKVSQGGRVLVTTNGDETLHAQVAAVADHEGSALIRVDTQHSLIHQGGAGGTSGSWRCCPRHGPLRPFRCGGLPQHGSRGTAHAAVAEPLLSTRHRRPHLRGAGHRQRLTRGHQTD